MVFDPFTKFKTGSENDDEAMQAGVDAIEALQKEFNVASWVPTTRARPGPAWMRGAA